MRTERDTGRQGSGCDTANPPTEDLHNQVSDQGFGDSPDSSKVIRY